MLEPIEHQYLLIGHISRSHGVHGEVLILSEIYAPTLFDEVDLVNLQNSRGDLIPARIESVRVREKENRLTFFVKFEHITDRNQAGSLKGHAVYVERDTAERLTEEMETPEDYSSFDVYDEKDRYIGRVEGALNNPAHPILQIAMKDNRHLLIPYVDEYVISTDEEKKIIRCQNLDQLEDV